MVTIKDVARRAGGVSVTTVSMILNNKSNRHSEETIARVKQAAADLGYQPNLRAKSLRENRTGTIGLILPDITNPYYPQVAKQLDEAFKQRGFSTLLLNSNESCDEEIRFLQMFRGGMFDGAVVFSRNLAKLASRFDLQTLEHTVFADDVDPREVPGHPVVSTDNEAGGHLLGSYLYEMGHRKIAFIGGYTNSMVTMGRLNGYRKAFREYGTEIAQRDIFLYDFSAETPRVALDRLNLNEVTAIACVNDIMAHQVIRCLKEAGRRVPEDVSVTGYDNLEMNGYLEYRLTTVEHFPGRLAQATVEQLIRSLEGEEPITETTWITPELVPGTTVRQLE